MLCEVGPITLHAGSSGGASSLLCPALFAVPPPHLRLLPVFFEQQESPLLAMKSSPFWNRFCTSFNSSWRSIPSLLPPLTSPSTLHAHHPSPSHPLPLLPPCHHTTQTRTHPTLPIPSPPHPTPPSRQPTSPPAYHPLALPPVSPDVCGLGGVR